MNLLGLSESEVWFPGQVEGCNISLDSSPTNLVLVAGLILAGLTSLFISFDLWRYKFGSLKHNSVSDQCHFQNLDKLENHHLSALIPFFAHAQMVESVLWWQSEENDPEGKKKID